MADVPFDAAKLQRLMAERGVDVVLASTRHNVRYLTGGYYHHFMARTARSGRGQYLALVGLPRDLRGAFHVGGRNEAEQIAQFGGLWIDDLLAAEPGRPVTVGAAVRAARALQQRGLGGATVGVEMPFLPADAFQALQQELPSATLVDAAPLLGELRAIKGPDEIERLRQVHVLTGAAIRNAMTESGLGRSTGDLADAVERHMAGRGAVFLYCLACVGPSLVRTPGAERWLPGRHLHLDAGGEVGDYVSDICRMGSLGEAPPEAAAMYEACLEANDRLRARLGAGLRYADVLRQGDSLMGATPWGDHAGFTAHGLGMVSHEPPELRTEGERTLEAGMVLSLETEFRRAGIGHVKFEDTVVITPSGCEGLGDEGREWCTVPA